MAKVLKNLLAGYGYNLVALPKPDITPLLMLYRNGNSLGSLDGGLDYFFENKSSEYPEIRHVKEVPAIEGSAVITYDVDGGISLLDSLLSKLNLGKLATRLKLNAAATISIGYEDVTEDKVSLLDLDNYISSGVPSQKQFNSYRDKLEKGQLYVVNAVLKSSAFYVSMQDSNGQELDAEAVIKGALNAGVSISRNKQNYMTLMSTGSPLVFAFKAQQIIYDTGKWWQVFNDGKFKIKDQQGEILMDESDYPTRPLELNTEPADI